MGTFTKVACSFFEIMPFAKILDKIKKLLTWNHMEKGFSKRYSSYGYDPFTTPKFWRMFPVMVFMKVNASWDFEISFF